MTHELNTTERVSVSQTDFQIGALHATTHFIHVETPVSDKPKMVVTVGID